MRSRTSRDDAGMDLFPFMAVLICTVGALIMLLVVMVQQARVKANTPNEMVAAKEPQVDLAAIEAEREAMLADHERRKKKAADKQYKVDEFKWKAELLRGSYEASVGRLADQRLSLSHLEQHTRELSDQAGRMQEEADLIAKAAKEKLENDEQSKQALEDLKSAVASAKSELDKTKEDLKNIDPKYVLIPYAGPNGTDRRPIYIECLNDRVILQPENVVLIGEDFLAPLTADNPLARALRGKREFLQENGLMGADSEPYPLLVVRPGAAATYAAARTAMKAWESEFGYELVESDVELDYMDADPRLTQLLEDIVVETRGRRRMMRSVRTRVQPRRRERLRQSASGGFETVAGGGQSFGANESGTIDDKLPFKTAESNRFANRGVGGEGNDRFGARNGGEGTGNGSGGRNSGSMVANQFRNGLGDVPGSGSSSGRGPGNELQFAGSGSGRGNSSERGAGQSQQGGPAAGSASGQVQPGQAIDSLAGQGDQGNPFRGGISGQGGGNSQNPGQGGTSADASGSGGKGASGSGGSGSQGSQGGAAGGQSQMGGTPASLADSRGSGWATANMQNDAVGIQRPIYIVCDRESLTLLPERGTNQELQVFRHRGSMRNVIDAFVSGIQDRLDGWGIAGQGIYWKPVLQIKVGKDSTAVYQQLTHLLNDSGIEVTREP